MRESQPAHGNGAAGGSGARLQGRRSIGEHGRRIHRDAAALAAEVQGTTADLEHYLTEQVARRPYRTLGVAAGIGYVVGGGLRSRLTAVVLTTLARVAVALVARELGARLAPQTTAVGQNKSS